MKQAGKRAGEDSAGASRGKGASNTGDIVGTIRVVPAAANRVNPKWAWHYRVLLGLRDRLLAERVDQLGNAAERLESHSMDMADSATDEFDHDMALAGLSAEQNALFEIEEALKRILNGTYGVCEVTGKAIPGERLKAIPWTRFVKEVEARLEGKGMVHRPHLGTLGSVRGEATGDWGESGWEEEKGSPEPEDEALQPVRPPAELPKRPRVAPPKSTPNKHGGPGYE